MQATRGFPSQTIQDFANPRASARAAAKVTGFERGDAGVIARVVAHGAPHPDTVTDTELIHRFGPEEKELTPATLRRYGCGWPCTVSARDGCGTPATTATSCAPGSVHNEPEP